MSENIAIATFGGGCFWCTEAQLKMVRGILKIVPGYAGGHKENPTYEEVCTGETGHAEVTQVYYDTSIMDYKELLMFFFLSHDPTQLNRQGDDVGTQYRSIILYHDEQQKADAEMVIEKMRAYNNDYQNIVTEVKALEKFYKAEDYHYDYFQNNPQNTYCQLVVAPKVIDFKEKILDLL